MTSFWKISFINPPEEQRQVVALFGYGEDNDPKVSKFRISVIRKIEEMCHHSKLEISSLIEYIICITIIFESQ